MIELRRVLPTASFLAVILMPGVMSCSDPAAPCPMCPNGAVRWDEDRTNPETGRPGACVIEEEPAFTVDNCCCGRDASGNPR